MNKSVILATLYSLAAASIYDSHDGTTSYAEQKYQDAGSAVYGERALREYGRRSAFQGLLTDYINNMESDESLVKAIIPESQPFFSRRPLTQVYQSKQPAQPQVKEDAKPHVSSKEVADASSRLRVFVTETRKTSPVIGWTSNLDTYVPEKQEAYTEAVPQWKTALYAPEPEEDCSECGDLLKKIKCLEEQLERQIQINQNCVV